MTGRPESLPLSLDQVKRDTDAAAAKHGGFDKVFDEIRQAMLHESNKPQAVQQKELRAYVDTMNGELAKFHFPKIEITFDRNGTHVNANGKELDPRTLAVKEPADKATASRPDMYAYDGGRRQPAENHQTSAQSAEYWKQHERKDDKEGTHVKVQKGDSLWRIAEHVAEERLGHKPDPKNKEDMAAVLKLTNEIAKHNHITITKDGHAMITEGQTINIPPKDKSSVPGRPDAPEKPGEKPPEKHEHPNHHGKVEVKGDTTTITGDDGAVTTIRRDANGDPVEVTRKGGHWAKEGKEGHFKAVDKDHWVGDHGEKFHGNVTVDKAGNYTYKDLDSGVSHTYRPDGSQIHTDGSGKPTSIKSPDGAHQHEYTLGKDNKWHAQPGGEQFDDVKIAPDGTVTAKGPGYTKEMRPDGSQVDKDGSGNVTFIQGPDGKQQHSYLQKDGKWIANPGGERFDAVQINDDGTVLTKVNGIVTTNRPDGSAIGRAGDGTCTYVRTPDGPNQRIYDQDPKTHQWREHPSNKEMGNVRVTDKGVIIADGVDGTKHVEFPNGAGLDYDSKHRLTHVHAADGQDYKMYYKGDETTPHFIIGGGHKLELDKSGKFYTEHGTKGRVNVKFENNGTITMEDATGKHVIDLGLSQSS